MSKMKETWKKITEFRPTDKQKKIALVAVILLTLALPHVVSSSYVMHILILCCLYSCITLSLNLIIGWSGQFSLGHVCFYGMGAYVTALLMMNFKINYFLATLIAVAVTVFLSLILCYPTLKLRGDYLAVVTLGFGEVFRLFLTNAVDITKGPAGIPGIPDPTVFGFTIKGKTAYFYFAVILVVLFVIAMKRINNSGFGMALIMVNEDDIAATFIGLNVKKYKLMSFAIGCGMAGLMGSFYAVYMGMISPTTFSYSESVKLVSMVVLGGVGSIEGSVLGAFLLAALPEGLRAFSDYRMVIYGAAMVLMMIFKPEGLWSRKKRILNEYKIKAMKQTGKASKE